MPRMGISAMESTAERGSAMKIREALAQLEALAHTYGQDTELYLDDPCTDWVLEIGFEYIPSKPHATQNRERNIPYVAVVSGYEASYHVSLSRTQEKPL